MVFIELIGHVNERGELEFPKPSNLPPGDVRIIIETFSAEVETAKPGKNEALQAIRRKAYGKARLYWQSMGENRKAAMTDEELDKQFGAFDAEGIPRLKSELQGQEPPAGSLAYAVKVIREMGGVQTVAPLDVTKADEVLNEEFADYLLRGMKGEDAAE